VGVAGGQHDRGVVGKPRQQQPEQQVVGEVIDRPVITMVVMPVPSLPDEPLGLTSYDPTASFALGLE
jgi:hypothetical protein